MLPGGMQMEQEGLMFPLLFNGATSSQLEFIIYNIYYILYTI